MVGLERYFRILMAASLAALGLDSAASTIAGKWRYSSFCYSRNQSAGCRESAEGQFILHSGQARYLFRRTVSITSCISYCFLLRIAPSRTPTTSFSTVASGESSGYTGLRSRLWPVRLRKLIVSIDSEWRSCCRNTIPLNKAWTYSYAGSTTPESVSSCRPLSVWPVLRSRKAAQQIKPSSLEDLLKRRLPSRVCFAPGRRATYF